MFTAHLNRALKITFYLFTAAFQVPLNEYDFSKAKISNIQSQVSPPNY